MERVHDVEAQHSTLSHGTMSATEHRGPFKPESSPNTQHLMNFKKSMKREISQYKIFKDENYFESFKRNLLVTTTTHNCEESSIQITYLDMIKTVKSCSIETVLHVQCFQQGPSK